MSETRTEREASQGSTHSQGAPATPGPRGGGGGVGGDSLERQSSTRGVGVRGVRGSCGWAPGPWPAMSTLLKSPEPWRTGLSMGGGV